MEKDTRPFSEINEERRLATAKLILSGQYRLSSGELYTGQSFDNSSFRNDWDRTEEIESYRRDKPNLFWGKKYKPL